MTGEEQLYPFDIPPFHFKGARIAAEKNGCTLLVGTKGNSILLSTELCEHIRGQSLSEGLCVKLRQHGMAQIDGVKSLAFERLPIPSYFIIDFTKKCNYNCIYCFRDNECAENRTNNRISDILEYICRYCEKNNVRRIGIQAWGGEPLIEADKIIGMARYFSDRNILAAIEVETNGSLIDDSMARRLRINGIRLGISMDGPREIQEKQRPSRNHLSSYDLTLRGINFVKKYYGSDFGSISVVTRYNVDIPEQMVDHLVDIGIRFAKFNIVRDNRFASESGLLPEIHQIEEFYRRLFYSVCDHRRRGDNITESTIQTRLENLVLSSRKNCCESQGCTGGRAIFSFDSEGDIYPCEMTDFKEEKIGSIDDGDLLDLLQHKKDSVFFRKREADICHSCPWLFYCRGGCTSRVHYCNSIGIDEVACAINRTLYPLIADLIVSEPDLADAFLRHN